MNHMIDIPTTMRAVYLIGQGGFDQLHYREDVPVPLPRPGEVLIRVSAAGVNNTDINFRSNWYARDDHQGVGSDTLAGQWKGSEKLAFPRIQGADVCGSIVATGERVDQTRSGERVIVDPVFRHPDAYFGADWNGGFAEYTTVPAANAHKVVCGLTDAELASFPCS
jgi:NADPH:quinone reductase-like Zn-dependent oxidoreductase